MLAAVLAVPWCVYFSLGPTPAALQTLATVFALVVYFGLLLNRDVSMEKQASVMALGWLVAGLLSAIAGLIQYFGFASGFQPWISDSSGVAFANLRQRNQFATLCVIALCAGIYVLRRNLTLQSPNDVPRSVLMAGIVLLAVGDSASQSRTGAVTLLVIISMALVWHQCVDITVRCLMWGVFPIYILMAWFLPVAAGQTAAGWGALSRLSESDAHCQSRLTLWSNVLQLIQQKPWIGWGWGELDYAHYISLFSGERFCAILDNAHNLPLHLAVELGVPFATVFCLGVVYAIWRQRPWAETNPTRQMAWMILAVIGLHSLLEYPLWYGPFQMTVILCIILLWRSKREVMAVDSEASTMKSPFRQYLYHLFAIVSISILSYVGWDYYRISQIYLPPQERSPGYVENTLAKIQGSWLFKPQVQFAELAITPLTQANADHQLQLALGLLHFSPEPRVVERVLDAALVLHKDDVVAFHMPRYQAAFPEAYAAWREKAMQLPQSSPTFLRAFPAASHP